MRLQKYYIAACWNPLDTRVPTLMVDADNEHGTYCKATEVDAELQRHKRAIEWLTSCGAIHIADNGTYFYGNTAAGNVPSDIADLIKGEK